MATPRHRGFLTKQKPITNLSVQTKKVILAIIVSVQVHKFYPVSGIMLKLDVTVTNIEKSTSYIGATDNGHSSTHISVALSLVNFKSIFPGISTI